MARADYDVFIVFIIFWPKYFCCQYIIFELTQSKVIYFIQKLTLKINLFHKKYI